MTLQSFANMFAFATIVVKTCIIVRTNTQRLNPNRQMTKQTNDKIDKADNSSIISSSPLFITQVTLLYKSNRNRNTQQAEVQSQQTPKQAELPLLYFFKRVPGLHIQLAYSRTLRRCDHRNDHHHHHRLFPYTPKENRQCQNATARSSILHTRPRLTPWLPLA